MAKHSYTKEQATEFFKAISLSYAESVSNMLKVDPTLVSVTRRFLPQTPLHLAVSREYVGIVNILLGAGAEVNARDYLQESPLHSAAKTGNRKIINILLTSGADRNAENIRGHTPAWCANDEGYPMDYVLKPGIRTKPAKKSSHVEQQEEREEKAAVSQDGSFGR